MPVFSQQLIDKITALGDVSIELFIDETTDREQNTMWSVDIITPAGLVDSEEYYDYQEAVADVYECEANLPNVSIKN